MSCDDKDNPLTNPYKAYEAALRIQESELNQLAVRNNFYIVFQGVIIAGFIQSYKDCNISFVYLIFALLGLFISFIHVRASESAKILFVASNNVVKYMEEYIEQKVKSADNANPVFLMHARGDTPKKRWEIFKKSANPSGEIGKNLTPPEGTVFFSCSNSFVKIFSAQSPSRQYVYAAYVFFAFWFILTVYLIIDFTGFYIDFGLRR